MNNYINEIVNTKINFLKSSYESNKNVNHQGIKGSLNEILLLELIKEIIPTKYKLTKGIIQDYNGYQSNESDILLYDNEILPALLFGGDLGFVPSESVKYIFEIKSTLNATELKSTIKKFKNLKNIIGFKGDSVLYSFSSDLTKKSDLERYYEADKSNFFHSPNIQVLTINQRGYYFFNIETMYIKELIDKNEFAKLSSKQNNFDFKIGDTTLKLQDNIDFEVKYNFIINDINYDDLKVYVYRWYGIKNNNSNNCELLSLLSGISNTLSKENFGKYLMNNCNNMKIYSECIVDMWGNTSYKYIDFDGYSKTKIKKLNFNISLNKNNKNNKIEIYPSK